MKGVVKENLYTVKIDAYRRWMTRRSSSKAPAHPVRRRSPAKEAARGRKRSASGSRAGSYHHGALHEALLKAAEQVLERDGLAGLTLRAVAREAGVSHAAPTHHFGDLTGLLSELAAIGFRRFNATMSMAASADAPPMERAMARAKAYVGYARAHPAMYGLMFRSERIDMTRPSLHEASQASFGGLAGAITGGGEKLAGTTLTLEQAAAIARAWSLVHGFTSLLLDGRLVDLLRRLPDVSAETLLDAMLRTTVVPGGSLPR